MPSPEYNIVQSVTKAIQYTGSNSADIDVQVPGVSITSEEGGVLTLNNGQHVLAINDWIIFNGFMTSSLTSNQYLTEWGCVALCAELNALASRVEALENP